MTLIAVQEWAMPDPTITALNMCTCGHHHSGHVPGGGQCYIDCPCKQFTPITSHCYVNGCPCAQFIRGQE